MRYNEILVENDIEPIDISSKEGDLIITNLKKYIEILKDCSHALSAALDGKMIYRGFDSMHDMMLLPKSKKTRRAAYYTHGDYYKDIFSQLPSWNESYRRDTAIIASTSDGKARMYGKLYVIFPVNGAKINYSIGRDWWDSYATIDNVELSFKEIMDDLYLNKDEVRDYISQHLTKFNRLLSPKAFGVTQITTKQIPSIPHDREVWTSDTCFALNLQDWYDIKRRLQND